MNGLLLNAFKSARQTFWEEGILYFPSLIEGEELARLSDACERIYDRNLEDARAKKPDGVDGLFEMRHLNHPKYEFGGQPDWKLILETAADARCVGLAEQVLGQRALFYTTSLYFNPLTGRRDGNWHRDVQFVLPGEEAVRDYFAPQKLGDRTRRCGVQMQIALVDSDDIEYVPFSPGRYDSPEEYYYRCADGRAHNAEAGMPSAMRVHLRAGDAIAFNPDGLHRGRYYSDIQRRTFMVTYTPHTSPIPNTYFSNQPWMLEPGHFDGISGRARAFYEEFVDAYRDTWLENARTPGRQPVY